MKIFVTNFSKNLTTVPTETLISVKKAEVEFIVHLHQVGIISTEERREDDISVADIVAAVYYKTEASGQD